jgi:hypothetical protein
VKLLALVELLPLVLMGATAQAPSCTEQRAANGPSVTAASGTLEDLSLYRPEELDAYELHCDQEIAAAIQRGDTAGAQSWARLRAAVIAEKQRRPQALAPASPEPMPTPRKTAARTRRRRHVRSEQEPTARPTPAPTPEQYPLPPGWPVGPKE